VEYSVQAGDRCIEHDTVVMCLLVFLRFQIRIPDDVPDIPNESFCGFPLKSQANEIGQLLFH